MKTDDQEYLNAFSAVKNKKIVLVQMLAGDRHIVKKFFVSDLTHYVETTSGVKSKLDYVKNFSICDSVNQAQKKLVSK